LAVSSRPILSASLHFGLSNKIGTAACSKKVKATFECIDVILSRKTSACSKRGH
jgi:hypothetical protein